MPGVSLCAATQPISCCSAAQLAAMQNTLATSVHPLLPSAQCRALVDELACAVVCSPYQAQWTTRDPLTLDFVVTVAPSTCALFDAAACGFSCLDLALPPLAFRIVLAT